MKPTKEEIISYLHCAISHFGLYKDCKLDCPYRTIEQLLDSCDKHSYYRRFVNHYSIKCDLEQLLSDAADELEASE